MASREFAYLYDPVFQLHEQGPGHPECPERVLAIHQLLEKNSLLDGAVVLPVRAAGDQELELVHEPAYLEQVRAVCAQGPASLGPDVMVVPGSLDSALHAAGAAVDAVKWVVSKPQRRAFANLRPPGHHALPGQAMGFCLFNNIAVAAKAVLAGGDAERVFVLDWDVHHGNGTQDIFYSDPRVFYCSFHQSPFYPGTGLLNEKGSGDAVGTTLNFPVGAGSGDQAVLGMLENAVWDKVAAFKPDLVMISCGFDGHRQDPLGGLAYSEEGYAKMTQWACRLADEFAQGRVLSLLEGGYSLPAIAASAAAHVRVLREV